MRILRHETGHAIENAYRLRRRRRRAAALRALVAALPAVLHAAARTASSFVHAPRALVRAEPSRRGLRRDVRGVARRPDSHWRERYAGLAGAQEARVRRRAHGGDRRHGRRSSPRAARRPAVAARGRRCASTTRRSAAATASIAGRPYDRDLRRLFSDVPEFRDTSDRPRIPRAGSAGRCAAGRALDRRVPVHRSTRCSSDIIERCRELGLRLAVPEEQAKLDFALAAHRADHELPPQRAASGVRCEDACASWRSCTRASCRPTTPGARRRRGRLEDRVRRRVHAPRARPRGAGRSASGSDLGVIREAIDEWKPHVVFNLLEDFDGVPIFDRTWSRYLELLRVPYTGCNPRGLMLAATRRSSKKILAYHRIPCARLRRLPDRPRRAPPVAPDLPADRASRSPRRRRPASRRRRWSRRRQARRARHLHPPEPRHRRDRRALHRRARALRRRHREPAPPGVPGLGAPV